MSRKVRQRKNNERSLPLAIKSEFPLELVLRRAGCQILKEDELLSFQPHVLRFIGCQWLISPNASNYYDAATIWDQSSTLAKCSSSLRQFHCIEIGQEISNRSISWLQHWLLIGSSKNSQKQSSEGRSYALWLGCIERNTQEDRRSLAHQ